MQNLPFKICKMSGCQSLLKGWIDPVDVNTSSKLSDLKPLHISWIVDFNGHLNNKPGMIINGFNIQGITEAVHVIQFVLQKVENPFESL